MAERKVECGVHYKPIFELSYYQELLGLTPQYLPNTAYAGKRVITLPLYPGLSLPEVDYICECIADIVAKHGR
jgi:dTDP-4-amino-4,6-dideoxygalactose transaminase